MAKKKSGKNLKGKNTVSKQKKAAKKSISKKSFPKKAKIIKKLKKKMHSRPIKHKIKIRRASKKDIFSKLRTQIEKDMRKAGRELKMPATKKVERKIEAYAKKTGDDVAKRLQKAGKQKGVFSKVRARIEKGMQRPDKAVEIPGLKNVERSIQTYAKKTRKGIEKEGKKAGREINVQKLEKAEKRIKIYAKNAKKGIEKSAASKEIKKKINAYKNSKKSEVRIEKDVKKIEVVSKQGKKTKVKSGMPTAEEIQKKIDEYKKGKSPESGTSAASEKEAKTFRNHLHAKAGKINGKAAGEFVKTGIEGFDQLLEEGIPKHSSLLVAGGPGTGKTIFCLQLIADACRNGKKAIYISFEENEDNLKKHMTDFGWMPDKWIKSGLLVIKRVSPYELSRSVEALLAKAKGELLIEFDGIPAILPKGFKPDLIVVDSLTAVAAAFVEKEDTYRIYIEQFFRLLEKMGSTSFLITETADTASTYSRSGVEEFLADGVIAMYHIRKENVRVRGIEIIKLRGVKHVEKLVPFDIVKDKGIVPYPEEEIFV